MCFLGDVELACVCCCLLVGYSWVIHGDFASSKKKVCFLFLVALALVKGHVFPLKMLVMGGSFVFGRIDKGTLNCTLHSTIRSTLQLYTLLQTRLYFTLYPSLYCTVLFQSPCIGNFSTKLSLII